MKALTEEFLRMRRNRCTMETMRQIRWQMGKFCRYLEEHGKDYRSVSKEEMETWLMAVTESRQIRRKMLLTVSSFYEFVAGHHPENASGNPCGGIQVRREKSKKLPQVPSMTQIMAALRDASNGTLWGLRNRAMLELAYGSGLRRAEIARLDVADIDFAAMTGRVTGKGGKIRIVPLTHAAREALREYLLERKAAHGPLFTAHPQGTRLTPPTLNGIFNKTGGIRPHLYRHACATHMLGNGCDIRTIQKLLGHKYLTTTQVYTHIYRHDLRCVINKIHPRSRNRLGPVRGNPLPATTNPFADA